MHVLGINLFTYFFDFKDQVKLINKENSELKIKLKNIEIESSKEESDRHQLILINKEQEK